MIGPDVYVHPQAIIEEGARVGPRTRVWAFAHILPGAVVGADCNICDHVFIENQVVIGDRVTIKCGVQVWDGVTLESDVFVGPNATFTNDPFPRSLQHLASHPPTVVHEGASVGANATVLPGLAIGRNSMVGAGAVVTRDVPAGAIVAGNPARIRGYVDTTKVVDRAVTAPPERRTSTKLGVRGAELIELPEVLDLRGNLTFGQLGDGLPFQPKRYYVVFGVPSPEVRGEHAHRHLEQLLICVHGSCNVIVDDGSRREEVHLSRPTMALHLTRMVWGIQYRFSADAVLLVLASEKYDAHDYVRNYEEFLVLTRSAPK
jgi:UDP-2-acetamido-3-amino-2,3-dideoxy-glucuronate N-acetyltransferase